MTLGWLTAFLDVPHDDHRAAVTFWSAVTATAESAPRGDHGQFRTAVPHVGEAFLRFQDVGASPARVHLDLHVVDVDDVADRAVTLGAVDQPSLPGIRTQRSPGGLTYCLVPYSEGGARPPAPWWPARSGTYACELDQVALDIPPDRYEREVVFWTALTEWSLSPSSTSPEFGFLAGGSSLPLRLLLQRLDSGSDPVTAHLDLACTDVPAEIERHVALGATRAYPGRGWQTMIDPTGQRYCLTGRTPH